MRESRCHDDRSGRLKCLHRRRMSWDGWAGMEIRTEMGGYAVRC